MINDTCSMFKLFPFCLHVDAVKNKTIRTDLLYKQVCSPFHSLHLWVQGNLFSPVLSVAILTGSMTRTFCLPHTEYSRWMMLILHCTDRYLDVERDMQFPALIRRFVMVPCVTSSLPSAQLPLKVYCTCNGHAEAHKVGTRQSIKESGLLYHNSMPVF